MGYERALLARDYKAEELRLDRDSKALAKKTGKKSSWGSIGASLGGLLAIGLTGGAATPLVAAAMAGGGTVLGGLAGQQLSGTGKINPNRISGGKFLQSTRDDIREDYKDVDKKLFESVLVSGLQSALTAGATQKLSLAKSGTPYKGFDISSLFGGEEWSPMNYAGDFSPEFLSQFDPNGFSEESSRPRVRVDKPAWDKSIYK